MSERVSIEEELARNGRGFFQTVGDSMEPLLHNRYSTVVIEKALGRLKKNDVALYCRPGKPNAHYVLHRVVKVRERDYLICGDNRLYQESVPQEWVIGVMTGFFNGAAYTSCDSAEYRQYVKTLGRRYFVRWCRAFPDRARRKLGL